MSDRTQTQIDHVSDLIETIHEIHGLLIYVRSTPLPEGQLEAIRKICDLADKASTAAFFLMSSLIDDSRGQNEN